MTENDGSQENSNFIIWVCKEKQHHCENFSLCFLDKIDYRVMKNSHNTTIM